MTQVAYPTSALKLLLHLSVASWAHIPNACTHSLLHNTVTKKGCASSNILRGPIVDEPMWAIYRNGNVLWCLNLVVSATWWTQHGKDGDNIHQQQGLGSLLGNVALQWRLLPACSTCKTGPKYGSTNELHCSCLASFTLLPRPEIFAAIAHQ